MKFAKFLATISQPALWKQPVIFFHGSRYPATFFSQLQFQLRSRGILTTPQGNLSRASISDAKDVLLHTQQTLLGNAQFYWLGDADELLTPKQKQLLLKTLVAYQGSNTIALFCSEPPSGAAANTSIGCPLTLTWEDFPHLVRFLLPRLEEQPAKLELARAIFERTGELDLDFCCLLLEYLDLTGARLLPQLRDYALSLVSHEHNLQGLSEAFFSKKEKIFFTLWGELGPQYPEIFWLAYWSDLCWRAHHVIDYIKQQKASLAKKMSFRLPYSFANGTWQQYEQQHFKKLFAILYETDFKIKTGFSFCFFEYLFATHFASPVARGRG